MLRCSRDSKTETLICRDEETGVAAVRSAFSSIHNDFSSEDEDEDGGFSDSLSYDGGEFEVGPFDVSQIPV